MNATEPATEDARRAGVVALDVGGVLLAIEPKATPRLLARWTGGETREVARALDESGLYHRHGLGKLTGREMCDAVRELLDAPGLSDAQVRAAWSASLGEVDPLIGPIAASLSHQGRLVLASNTNEWHWREVRIRLAAAGLRADTPVVLSHELGLLKPDPAFYAALRALAPVISVFVDDLAENVTAARACGIPAHHHDDPRGSVGILQPMAEAFSTGVGA